MFQLQTSVDSVYVENVSTNEVKFVLFLFETLLCCSIACCNDITSRKQQRN